MDLVGIAKLVSPYISPGNGMKLEAGAQYVQVQAGKAHGVYKETFKGSPQREMAAIGGTLILMKTLKIKPLISVGTILMGVAFMTSEN